MIKTADWIIDHGPEGGDGSGEIVAAGPPEAMVREARSYTGAFLKPVLTPRVAARKRGAGVEAAESKPCGPRTSHLPSQGGDGMMAPS